MEMWHAKAAVEAILMASPRPVRLGQLAEAMGCEVDFVEQAVREYQTDVSAADRGVQVRHTRLGLRMEAKPNFAAFIEAAVPEWAQKPISSQALETLAIIALKGPVTLSDINAIRGVDSTGTLLTLRNRQLVARVVRPGRRREKFWKTTPLFLEVFNLSSLDELTKEGKLEETFPSVFNADLPDMPPTIEAEVQLTWA